MEVRRGGGHRRGFPERVEQDAGSVRMDRGKKARMSMLEEVCHHEVLVPGIPYLPLLSLGSRCFSMLVASTALVKCLQAISTL